MEVFTSYLHVPDCAERIHTGLNIFVYIFLGVRAVI